MKRWMLELGLTLMVVALLAVPAMTLAAGGPPNGRGQGNGGGMAQPVAVGSLTAEQQAVLGDFWTDEHRALAVYQAALAQFGDVLPFSMIVQAEQSHIAALERLFVRYDLVIPATPVFDTPVFATQTEACTVAAQAERDNAALYYALQAQFTQPDILRMITNLRSASLNQLLPAFEACAAGTYTGGGFSGRQGSAGALAGNGAPFGTTGQGNPSAPRGNAQSANCPMVQP